MKVRKIIFVIIFILLVTYVFLLTRTLVNKSTNITQNVRSADKETASTVTSNSNSKSEGVSSNTSSNLNDKDTETNDPESMSKWLDKKLAPGNSTDKGEKKIQTYVGWMFDRDCIGINPVKHTKACNLMGTCSSSGLGIIPYITGKDFDTYIALDNFIVFDGNSTNVARAFLRCLPEDWKNNITIKIKGYAVNNIPTNADESKVPEEDASKVDHKLSGIHITSIEAAYIDGLSTYKLPVPNIVFPKP